MDKLPSIMSTEKLEVILSNDEKLQSDIKFCLYCIYNGHNLSQYFPQLMRILQTLREYQQVDSRLTANTLLVLLEANVRDFVSGGIRDKLVEEIRASGLIGQKAPERRHSMDDYFLIDRVFSKSYTTQGLNNELFYHCSKYLLDSTKYEQVKSELRSRIWHELKKNNETMLSLSSKPDSFRKIFDWIVRYYTRMCDAVLPIEEMWVFLVEALF